MGTTTMLRSCYRGGPAVKRQVSLHFLLFLVEERLWVAKTSSAPKSLICSDLRPSCHPLFLVPWPGPTPREQQFARHRVCATAFRLEISCRSVTLRTRASSPESRCSVRLFRTAVAIAFCCSMSTTRLLPPTGCPCERG
jgi:hypothetical protein